jgi:hypothetical protein
MPQAVHIQLWGIFLYITSFYLIKTRLCKVSTGYTVCIDDRYAITYHWNAFAVPVTGVYTPPIVSPTPPDVASFLPHRLIIHRCSISYTNVSRARRMTSWHERVDYRAGKRRSEQDKTWDRNALLVRLTHSYYYGTIIRTASKIARLISAHGDAYVLSRDISLV